MERPFQIGKLDGSYRYLLVSPVSMKTGIISLIDREIAKGPEGRITCKLNGWCNYKANDVVGISITRKRFFDKETTNAIKVEV